MANERQLIPVFEINNYSLETIRDPQLRDFALQVQEISRSFLATILQNGQNKKGLYIPEIIKLVQCTFGELVTEVPSKSLLKTYLENKPLVVLEKENTRQGKRIGNVGTLLALSIYFHEKEKVFSQEKRWTNINKIPRLDVFSRTKSDLGGDHPLLASYIIPNEKLGMVTIGEIETKGRIRVRDNNNVDEEAFLRSADDIFLGEILRKMSMANLAKDFDTFSIQRMIDRDVLWDNSFEAAMLFDKIIITIRTERLQQGLRVSRIGEATFEEVFNYTQEFLGLMKKFGSTNVRDLYKDSLKRAEEARKEITLASALSS